MPVIHLYSPADSPGNEFLEGICRKVTSLLQIPSDHCWVLWHKMPTGSYQKADWMLSNDFFAPVVQLQCKAKYSEDQIRQLLNEIANFIVDELDCKKNHLFISVQRLIPSEVFIRGNLNA